MNKLFLTLKNFYISWQTTVAGILITLPLIWTQIGYGFDADPLTKIDWNIVLPAFGALFGFGAAKDGVVSTEDVKKDQ